MNDKIKESAKAIGGAVLSGLITLTAVMDPTDGPADVTFFQWLLVGVSVLGTGIGIYAIPNRAPVSQKVADSSGHEVPD
ncbi:hypothetical protein [Diaminobutyricimonas sp. LJ205]|uniref:hypothetical protein n=1 Tax=Diaminobutyricimonas sp. LJ205 TaxID=2683590 RepID=UPI0012F4E60C|nr:hypothetical protein [Diaminobutyricimonas sp. LJ205]